MSAGVGKTYAMLKDAQDDIKNGIDVVAGYIEPHGRRETEDLVESFEVIPFKEVTHEGITLKEFDLDSALKRAPHTILVDELAHTNVPGSLHNKRWLDIQTLLDAGINVYSTLNIQHLESISELVSSLTGITVHETVPDSVLRESDSIEVIDIPPDELIERLKSGKIYKGDKIEAALKNFFKEGSLLALREVLLRKAAEKIDSDVIKFRQTEFIRDSWASSDRMLVAIGPNRFAKRLIKKAGLIAASRKSNLTVVYVQTPHLGTLSANDQHLVDDALDTAQGLGATIERRYGVDIVSEILKCAIELNASLIVIGKPIKNRLRDLIIGSLADDLVRRSGNIDVVLVTGEAEEATARPIIVRNQRPKILSTFYALCVVAACTIGSYIVEPYVEVATIAMIYILGSVIIARNSGRTESVIASVVSILCFNYFFIEPKFTFNVYNTEYLITFIAMLAVSLSISGLITRIRLQNLIVQNREKRALTLYDAGRLINQAKSEDEILKTTQSSILRLGEFDCGILIAQDQTLRSGVSSQTFFEIRPEEFAVARYVMGKKEAAGYSTDTLPGSSGLYIPIQTDRKLYGICGLTPLLLYKDDVPDKDIISTIELILQQAAISMERLSLEKEATNTKLKAETEGMRSLILSSVSHDFKTPLTVIEGAAEQIMTSSISTADIHELSKLILMHSHRLSRVVHNALSFAKLEGNSPKLNLEWESIEEIIGQALEKYRKQLKNRAITVDYPDDLPLLRLDAVLMDQLIVNVIENSITHASGASFLKIMVKLTSANLEIYISDDGAQVNGSSNSKQLKQDTDRHTGIGFGVPICELIAKLHNGTFTQEPIPSGGTVVTLKLPLSASQTKEATHGA